jgi:hypothetical protein
MKRSRKQSTECPRSENRILHTKSPLDKTNGDFNIILKQKAPSGLPGGAFRIGEIYEIRDTLYYVVTFALLYTGFIN